MEEGHRGSRRRGRCAPRVAGAAACAVAAVMLTALALSLLAVEVQAQNDPPVAVISSPRPATEYLVGQVITFDARASWDDDIANLSYSWDFTDSVVEGRDKVVHERAFLVPGDYLVRLTVTDAEGLNDTATVRVIIRSQNLPPAAYIKEPAEGARLLVDRPIVFDGSTSSDPEGGQLRFVWEVNRTSALIGDRERFNVRLPLGRYRVTLTVYDLAGANGTATINISVVTNRAPVLDGGSVDPPAGPEGLEGGYAFRVTYSDPEGDAPVEVLLKVGHRGVLTTYAMSPEDPRDTNYRNGVVFLARVNVAVGAHQYVFSCRDAFFSCATALFDGPAVYLVEELAIPPLGAHLAVNWSERGTVTVTRASAPALPPEGTVLLSSVVRVELSVGEWTSARLELGYRASSAIDPATVGLWRYDPARSLWVPTTAQHHDLLAGLVDGDVGEAVATLAVFGAVSSTQQNHPPTLRVSYETDDAYAGRELELDASGSTDPDGGVLLFYWAFSATPGGAAGGEWVAGEKVTHVFEEAGVYEVLLRAVDAGEEHTLSTNVSIRKYKAEPPGPLDNPGVLFVMATLLVLAAAVAVFNRLRVGPARTYDDEFGDAYAEREEDEYSRLFRKLTEDELRGRPPDEGETEGLGEEADVSEAGEGDGGEDIPSEEERPGGENDPEARDPLEQ